MKKHLLLTCISYAYYGFGVAVQMFGIKAGLGLTTCLSIYISSVLFFIFVVFTSFEKIKEQLFKKDSTTPPNQ